MSDTMKKIGKVLLAAAGIAAVGFAVKKWLEGKQELNNIPEDEDIFEEEECGKQALMEKALAEAKTVELHGELPDITIRAAAASVTYDLSETVMSADRMIEIQALCSNVRIECPVGVRVQMTGDGKLSSLLCSASVPEEDTAPVLYVHVTCLASAVLVK